MKMTMFRIVMPAKAIIEHSQEEMLRLESLIKASGPEHIRATIWKDPTTFNQIIDGQASPPMLHLLMTAAKGEKLTPVMDAFERKEEQWSPGHSSVQHVDVRRHSPKSQE